MLLAGLLVTLALFFQWRIAEDALAFSHMQTRYQHELEDYRQRNIFYTPELTIQWVVNRQNPAGYFVSNPDMLFEPSQLNDSSLRTTRYAISILCDLKALRRINRRAVAEYVFSLYQQELPRNSAAGSVLTSAFGTKPGAIPGVRPSMDALIILEALDLLDDPRLDLRRIRDFILVHQNPDGGFWDEHYPKLGHQSSMKATSFAARALGILQRHLQQPLDASVGAAVRNYVRSMADTQQGGYRGHQGSDSDDVYNVFRAFISIMETANGDRLSRHRLVEREINVDQLLQQLLAQWYLPGSGAFSRFRNTQQDQPSFKATHLVVWLAWELDRLKPFDAQAISRFVTFLQSTNGQYGGDIYTTYSAIGLLQKLHVPTAPMQPPQKPERPGSIPSYVPAAFLLAALVILLAGMQIRKLELQNINRALSIQANIDSLTGIYNRQKFESLLREEYEKYLQYHRPLSLIMFDVDDFKSINDQHGHLVGDQVLRKISSRIKGGLRSSDIFARWGGEEFVVLLPDTARVGAFHLANKLRALLDASQFDSGLKVTASFGVTGMLEQDSTEDFLERADMAMLYAKAQGKNRVYSVVSDVRAELMSESCA